MKTTIPADVPREAEQTYRDNYSAITHNKQRLMLFACDQKIEHLNDDFFGPNIHPDANNPKHIFNIASQSTIGALATHFGLVARYGKQYPDINYIVKINGKTNLIPEEQLDPISAHLSHVEDVVQFKKDSKLNIRGVGCTIYLGSEYEHIMLEQAAQMVYQAHQHGLVALIWIYPRGKAITHEQDALLLAGATGLAVSLGADFVKIKPPMSTQEKTSAQLLTIATEAAGNTKLICSGGSFKEPSEFLQQLHAQIHIGGTVGNATGRNIFQRSLSEAIALSNAIAAIVLENKTVNDAMQVYTTTLEKNKQ